MRMRHVLSQTILMDSRPLYGLLALLLGAGVAILLITREVSGWYALAFALAPDAALVLGVAPDLAKGQIHPRAVPLYNTLHHFGGPILLAVASLLWLGQPWLVAALSWASHIALDRSLGIGLRTRAGFMRG